MMNVLAYSTDVPAGIVGQLGYGLGVTAIGVIIVFAVLILIMFVICLFQAIFGQKNESAKKVDNVPVAAPKKVVATAPVASSNPEEVVAAIAAATAMAQEELIVVLSAAVAAQEGCDPASSRYRIRSFRRIL